MANNIEFSVYELVTNLCEHLLKNKVKDDKRSDKDDKISIQKLRSIAYSILLKKSFHIDQNENRCLTDNEDPYCELAAWNYELVNKYGRGDISDKIKVASDNLNELTVRKSVVYDGLTLLLKLKQPPKCEPVDLIVRKTGSLLFRHFSEENFTFPSKLSLFNLKLNNNIKSSSYSILTRKRKSHFSKSCDFQAQKSVIFSKYDTSLITSVDSSTSLKLSEHSTDVLVTSARKSDVCESLGFDKLWDIASNSEYNERRSWECFGNPTPFLEKQFMSETSPKIVSLAIDLKCNNFMDKLVRITQAEFMRDLKNILVGISSSTFKLDVKNSPCLQPNISVENFSSVTLFAFSKDILNFASNYIILQELVNTNTSCHRRQYGFIFTEFCSNVEQYLTYYRLAVDLPTSDWGLIRLRAYLDRLGGPLRALSNVCSFAIPSCSASNTETHTKFRTGIELLNILYECARHYPDKGSMLVLHGVLQSCLQVYFSIFLKPWILQGTISDPYNEFFITINRKYQTIRTRGFWIRSFEINPKLVPKFLSDWTQEIFDCGKIMNLMKLCYPQSPICRSISFANKSNLMKCCLTENQLNLLRNDVSLHYLSILSAIGSKFMLVSYLDQEKVENEILLNLIARKRVATLKRIEVEKLKQLEQIATKKREEMKIVQNNYDEAMKNKLLKQSEASLYDLKMTENQLKMKLLEEKIIKEEM